MLTNDRQREGAVDRALHLMYAALEDRLHQAEDALQHESSSSSEIYDAARSMAAGLLSAVNTASRQPLLGQVGALLAYIVERLNLSDDRIAAVTESRRLIAPVAAALGELADAARLPAAPAPRLHS